MFHHNTIIINDIDNKEIQSAKVAKNSNTFQHL